MQHIAFLLSLSSFFFSSLSLTPPKNNIASLTLYISLSLSLSLSFLPFVGGGASPPNETLSSYVKQVFSWEFIGCSFLIHLQTLIVSIYIKKCTYACIGVFINKAFSIHSFQISRSVLVNIISERITDVNM